MAVLFAEMRWNSSTFDMWKLFADIGHRTHVSSQSFDPLDGILMTVNGVGHSYASDSVTFAKLFMLGSSQDSGFGGDGIVINAANEVSAGQANILGLTNRAGLNYEIAGFSVALADLYASSLTADLADDQAMQKEVFSGDDFVVLEYAPFQPIPSSSGGGNRFNSGAGKDYILGATGNDTLNSGDGNDIIQSGFGNDSVVGGKGNDLLFGEAGMDKIEGRQGNDIVIGGADRDILDGGGGKDLFVFAPGGAQDVVVDFEDGLDRIVISGIATDFDGLSLFQGVSGVQVSFSDSSFMLANVLASDLSAADFIFGGNGMINTAADRFLCRLELLRLIAVFSAPAAGLG